DERDLKAGDVRDDVALLEIAEDPAQPLEIDAQLVDARLDRHVQRRDRAGPDDAVSIETVQPLKGPHGGLERLVEELGVGALPRGISFDPQPLPKLRDARIPHPWPKRAAFQKRPSACALDA